MCCVQRELNGHNYYEFEYTAKNPRYTRHSVAVVVANDGERHNAHTHSIGSGSTDSDSDQMHVPSGPADSM